MGLGTIKGYQEAITPTALQCLSQISNSVSVEAGLHWSWMTWKSSYIHVVSFNLSTKLICHILI